jgi:hypothetical protein
VSSIAELAILANIAIKSEISAYLAMKIGCNAGVLGI